jgi:hypothetical protein
MRQIKIFFTKFELIMVNHGEILKMEDLVDFENG